MGQSKTGARFCNEDVKVVDVTEKAKKAWLSRCGRFIGRGEEELIKEVCVC